MGVKEFFGEVTADVDIRKRYLDPAHPEMSGDGLKNLLDEMAWAGREGIRSFHPNSKTSEVAGVDKEDLGRIYRMGIENFGAIFLASLVHSVVEMIEDRAVSVRTFANRANGFFEGTLVEPLDVGEDAVDVEHIPDEKYRDIIAAATKDKTMASFIRKPELLPKELRAYLERRGLLKCMLLVVDDYEVRARLIVSGPNSQSSKSS